MKVDLGSLRRIQATAAGFSHSGARCSAHRQFGGPLSAPLAGASRDHPELPKPRPTLPRLASVFLEELMLIGAAGIDKRIHDEVEVRRISDDTDVALALFAESGWLDSPAGYHQAPTAPETFTLTPAKFLCNRYERLEFPSDYVPTPGSPEPIAGSQWKPTGPCTPM